MRSLSQSLLFLVLPLFAFADAEGPQARKGFDWKTPSLYAVQDRGRIKPLDTFARETVQFVTGKSSWKGKSSVEVIFGWLIAFEKEWENEPFIRVAYAPVKQQLGLPSDRQFFSPEELRSNEALRTAVREILQKQRSGDSPSDLDQKILQVQNQRALVEATVSGQAWNLIPHPEGPLSGWLSLAALTDRTAAEVLPLAKVETTRASVGRVLESFAASRAEDWNTAVLDLGAVLEHTLGGGKYPSTTVLAVERFYNTFRPFRWSWVGYLIAFVLLWGFLVTAKPGLRWAGLSALVLGFSIHSIGFILRMVIAGRPPVTNMYESVIWVSWGCVLFALFIGGSYKKAIIPAAASVFAVVSLVLADALPSVLDPSIQPLEPVLRSNFWLTIHVLTITLSYAAFALSLCLGNVVLGHYYFSPGKTEVIQFSSLYMYRAIQIGVVLLAAGTILGGVWADYSWGRFWGWDPKEVWALIALLLYLAVLHGRYAGLLQGFGFATCTVVSFLGVLMAWYGVNFVLGAGLHSYGFGSGGMGYVVAYVAAQLGFIGAAYYRYRKSGGHRKRVPIFPKEK